MNRSRPGMNPGLSRVHLGTKTSMFHYIYILKLKNKNWYTGYTSNLKQRLEDHKYGKVQSTKYLLPIELIHYEAYKIKEDAERRERFLKTSDGKRFLKQQLSILHSQIKTT